MITTKIKPNWIAQLFYSFLEITVTQDQITIYTKRDEIIIKIDSLTELPRLEKKLFFYSLPLQHNNIIKGFNKNIGLQLLDAIHKAWYLNKFEDVNHFYHEINGCGKDQYLRSSIFNQLKTKALQLKNKYRHVPRIELLPHEKIIPFTYVDRLAVSGNQFLKEVREEFIASEIDQYSELFDSVESSPLTKKQREACVIDNDNNLVLAGAGTGKTSTMVGKAGYLIQSKKAKPDEILLLAFGNKAAEELQERISDKLNNTEIIASTFHKLGKSIISAVEEKSSSVCELAADREKREKYIDDCLNELLTDPDYEKNAVTYFSRYLYPDANPFDFKTQGEYFEYLADNEIRSLKGDEVKSYGELLIANYFFINGIDYEYERAYEINTRTLEFQQYKPDFYLVDYGIYLEHYGINRRGGTAPYINSQKYNEQIAWKRNLHETNKTICLETFHYEKEEGTLLDNLEKQLAKHKVVFNPISDDGILASLRERGEIRILSKLLSELLNNVKNQCRTRDEAIAIAQRASNSSQAMAALNLLTPILDRYEQELTKNNEIDFNDMIHRATQYVLEGKFKPSWKYILVDEFQDIGAPRANLINALRDHSNNCVLFCVGDDWQSIYRFTGSDLNYTTQFGENFGFFTTTFLDKTYRFNNSICDTASKFVTQNPAQKKKELITHNQVSSSAISVLKRKKSSDLKHVATVLDKITSLSVDSKSTSVYIISRYNFLVNYHELRTLAKNYPTLDVKQISMHGSKGKEADYVIIIGLEKGEHGFPSEKITHPLLELYLPPEEPFINAEERRLFYVAITRARKRVYLIADMTKPSSFMKELLQKGHYDLCLDEFDTPIDQSEYEFLNCPSCETGTLQIKENSSTGKKFLGCSNWKRCQHTENMCPICKNMMTHIDRFRVCTNSKCNWKIARCPECSGEMKLRERTKHWGCSNYRTDHPSPCTHQERFIDFTEV